MDSYAARAYLKRNIAEEQLVRELLRFHGLNYDTFNNWELREIRVPSPDSFSGEEKIKKLYIANNFICNTSPLTEELIKQLKSRYNMEESQVVKECRSLRKALSEIIYYVGILKNRGNYIIFQKVLDSLVMARYWLWEDLRRNMVDVKYDVDDEKYLPSGSVEEVTTVQIINRLESLIEIPSSGYQHSKAIEHMREAFGWILFHLNVKILDDLEPENVNQFKDNNITLEDHLKIEPNDS